ncbi:MAG: DUF2237 domain-containing protein [Thermoanaerobaculia bacterium]|nr:DUF2237 domain-containing protein [Thermoanaerobaculia bacterium]
MTEFHDEISTPDEAPKNVLGGRLQMCSVAPRTGFYRNGRCDTDDRDVGCHAVCAQVTEEFLVYSRDQGNDLTSPSPLLQFAGLRPGDRWCICAPRWKEALDAGKAPPVVLAATHERALDYVELEDLLAHALDVS